MKASNTVTDLYHTATVRPWGFDIDVTFDYDPGEAPVYALPPDAHPGSDPFTVIMQAKIAGVEVYDMLGDKQLRVLEEHALRAMGD